MTIKIALVLWFALSMGVWRGNTGRAPLWLFPFAPLAIALDVVCIVMFPLWNPTWRKNALETWSDFGTRLSGAFLVASLMFWVLQPEWRLALGALWCSIPAIWLVAEYEYPSERPASHYLMYVLSLAGLIWTLWLVQFGFPSWQPVSWMMAMGLPYVFLAQMTFPEEISRFNLWASTYLRMVAYLPQLIRRGY